MKLKKPYRVTSDLTGIVNKGIEELKDRSYRFIVNELSAIESIVTHENSRTEEIQSAIDIINRYPENQ